MIRWTNRCALVLIGACAAALSPSVASAAVVWDDDTDFVVTKLQVYKDGRVWVFLDKNINTSNNGGGAQSCIDVNKAQIHTSATADGRELMMKVLVAVQLSGRTVKLRVELEGSTCMLHEIAMQ